MVEFLCMLYGLISLKKALPLHITAAYYKNTEYMGQYMILTIVGMFEGEACLRISQCYCSLTTYGVSKLSNE